MPRMFYSLSALAFVLTFIGLSLLLGLGILARLGLVRGSFEPVLALLAVPVGMGVVIVTLFGLALAGLLVVPALLAAAVTLLAAGLWCLQKYSPSLLQALRSAATASVQFSRDHPYTSVALLIATVLGFLRAMSAPLEWDELMYHLPYAQDYAEAGSLVVSERLRFPLHSHNVQLLWATALLFSSEAATHLVNAFCAALTAAGIFAWARSRFGNATAIIAAVVFVYFCRELIDTAYVDLPLTLFVFFSFVSLTQWQSSRQEGFLYVSAFLLAMAAGTKYQGLLQLPAFGLALLVASRGAFAPLARAAIVFTLFGSGWYLRNWLLSGDPLHPIGGPYFGFWHWDAADLASQYSDFDRYGHHIPLILVPALAVIALPLAWYLSSRYDRYLLPSIPFLAILSAQALVTLARLMGSVRAGPPPRLSSAARSWLGLCGLALVFLAAAVVAAKQWPETCFTRACAETTWSENMLSSPAAREISDFGALNLYQYGFENEIYTLPENTAGDWYGPYRYRSVRALQHDPAALSEHLRSLRRDSLLVNRGRDYFNEFPAGDALAPSFETLYDDGRVSLYRLKQRP
jgi:hypothetical protein